ncbi:MarR family winged helix-turn-helix transcriptional regulator [Undibacterium sp. TJN19]|uniref:MarR family winged helix-turn-helix transcriptional regulator n=1 Tax=Undibacterium sp. TJN19 TaxID=3413055 RepID=UPI003BF062BF
MRKQNLQGTTVPAVGEGKRGEQGYTGYLLGQAYAAHRIRMEKALVDKGITLPQFSVLTMLAAYPGASGADLARLALLTPQTMSVIVSNLERDGMVTRQPHPVHGRIQLIDITAEGRALLAQCKHLVQPIGQSLTAGLGAEEEKIVRRWLVEIAQGGVV